MYRVCPLCGFSVNARVSAQWFHHCPEARGFTVELKNALTDPGIQEQMDKLYEKCSVSVDNTMQSIENKMQAIHEAMEALKPTQVRDGQRIVRFRTRTDLVIQEQEAIAVFVARIKDVMDEHLMGVEDMEVDGVPFCPERLAGDPRALTVEEYNELLRTKKETTSPYPREPDDFDDIPF